MRRFTRLLMELDAATGRSRKEEALSRYFAAAPAEDAAWAVALLTGRRATRAVPAGLLRELAAERAGLAAWLVGECRDAVGDLCEALALVVPDAPGLPAGGCDESLSGVIASRVLPLGGMSRAEQRRAVAEAWEVFDSDQRFVFHKLISAGSRFGVSRGLLVRALAQRAGLDAAIVDDRLSGEWAPSAGAFAGLVAPARGGGGEPGCPYPFYLAHVLEAGPEPLGRCSGWVVEWKWDGVRAQLLRRGGRSVLWSRGEEMIGGMFPELTAAGMSLPEGTVLDGQVLAYEGGGPLPPGSLERRLSRRGVEREFWPEVPVVFMAYDLLEEEGRDLRHEALARRRAGLEQLIARADEPLLRASPGLEVRSWEEAQRLLARARETGVTGLMIKRGDSPYLSGRERGAWWKLKVEPHRLRMTLVAAQAGRGEGRGEEPGERTEYSFALREGGAWVTVARASGGLDAGEMEELGRWVRRHTTGRKGPVRMVEPGQVFEVEFESVQRSPRRRGGLAVCGPRMARWRRDLKPEAVDGLEALRALLPAEAGRGG